MKQISLSLLFVLLSFSVFSKSVLKEKNLIKKEGYFTSYYSDSTGKFYLDVTELNQEFLLVNYLSQGLGNNDIGMDRGMRGGSRIVYFKKMGDKLMLMQPNLRFRALSENDLERKAVEQAFVKSVLQGFKIVEKTAEGYLIDLTPLLMEDLNNVAGTLGNRGNGSYNVDKTKCSLDYENCKSFPENLELEVLMTYKGKAKGGKLWTVTSNPQLLTFYQHVSIVKLPKEGYKARTWHPQCGSFPFSYYDYAAPVQESTEKKFIERHRLEKKNPGEAVSEAVEPIIYYLDNGTPEPVRSALLDGGRWWNEAFEAIGYKDAFQFEILPDSADPLDIRYNVVQWVHRSSRGWSYGRTVVDPRTGEIIKGHVSLGSLRIRQDFKIAQALSKEPFKDSDESYQPMLEMALARIRQLAAHEIGHTLGFAHNFAASTNDRASVMDYPHPLLRLKDGAIDLSNAYDVGIGEWDKVTVAYSYSEYSDDAAETSSLNKILTEAFSKGYRYISDADARPKGGSHAKGHLWDNGPDVLKEFENIVEVRNVAMNQFSIHNIRSNQEIAELEDLFVLVYFLHRYQTEAVVKLIGGQNYHYAIKGDGQESWSWVSAEEQRVAFYTMLVSLQPDFLEVPEPLIKLFVPRASGRDRESFNVNTSPSFDAISIARSSAKFSLDMMLHPARLSRLVQQHAMDESYLGLDEYIKMLISTCIKKTYPDAYKNELNNAIAADLLESLMTAAQNSKAYPQVGFVIDNHLKDLVSYVDKQKEATAAQLGYKAMIEAYLKDPSGFEASKVPEMPDGSPIGCLSEH